MCIELKKSLDNFIQENIVYKIKTKRSKKLFPISTVELSIQKVNEQVHVYLGSVEHLDDSDSFVL